MKCFDCIYHIQGENSIVCCHPDGNQKYCYPVGYNDCIIPGKGRKSKLDQSEQFQVTAKKVNWLKVENNDFIYYIPVE